jgi:hypothetical protein
MSGILSPEAAKYNGGRLGMGKTKQELEAIFDELSNETKYQFMTIFQINNLL